METRGGDLVPLSWPWLVVTTTVLCGLLLLYLWWQHRYGRNIGPKVFPIVGCLPQMIMNGNRLYDWTTEELKKTPTMTMRVSVPGMEYVETGNPVNLEHILKTNFQDYPKGDFFGSFFTDLLGLGIFNADGRLWKVQRRVGSQEFNTGTLQESATHSVQRELTERFLPLLDRSCDTNASVDLQDLLLRFTFDTICQLAFGTDPGCLKSEMSSAPVPFESFAKAFDDAVLQSTIRVWSVFPPWQVKQFFNVGSERKLRQSLATIDSFAFDLIRTRRKEVLAGGGHNQAKLDLLSRFIKIADDVVESPEIKQRIEQDPRSKHQNPSDLFLRDIVISFILAGRDTSACGLTWFFWVLSSYPRVEAEIYNEIQATIASRKEELPTENCLVFSFEELKNMHYLHAALIESMRLYPPVPDDSKEAAVDNVFPDGTIIPKGIRVSFHMYAMGRSESIWGPDWSILSMATVTMILVLTLVVLLAIMESASVTCAGPTNVSIWNEIGGSIQMHCQSVDSDLKEMTLAAGETFAWAFTPSSNILGRTIYCCRFTWGAKTQIFNVWTEGICGQYVVCMWTVRRDGFWLKENGPEHNKFQFIYPRLLKP